MSTIFSAYYSSNDECLPLTNEKWRKDEGTSGEYPSSRRRRIRLNQSDAQKEKEKRDSLFRMRRKRSLENSEKNLARRRKNVEGHQTDPYGKCREFSILMSLYLHGQSGRTRRHVYRRQGDASIPSPGKKLVRSRSQKVNRKEKNAFGIYLCRSIDLPRTYVASVQSLCNL